ncbi:MAG: KAP family P-loop NTPase fold protein, partial [Bacteroidales bacterium]
MSIKSFQDYIRNNFSKIVLVSILFLSIIVFKEEYISLINNIWVNPIASKLNNVIYPIVVLVLTCFYYIIVIANEKKYNIGRLFLLISLLSLYLICKWMDLWVYYNGVLDINYASILYVPLLFEFLLLFKQCRSRKNQHSPLFIYEDPSSNNDEYDRSQFINSLFEQIKYSFYSEGSFAIGICGEWGSGKTCVLEKLKDQYVLSKNIDSIISFNPWHSDNYKVIVYDFLIAFSNEIKRYIPQLSDDLYKYASMLTSELHDDKILNSIMDKLVSKFSHESLDTKSQYKKISDQLRSTPVRVLVIIDDLDRLDKNELLSVLRLIRNSVNFPYLQFIVSYDKEYILNTIDNDNPHLAHNYLQKIFNVEIHLPKFDDDIICRTLSLKLQEILS